MNAPIKTDSHEMTAAPVHQITSVQAHDIMMNDDTMNRLMRFAEVMASSTVTIPKHLQKNAGDCFAVVMQAAQWGMNPFAVAQKTHIVNGNLGYEAQLVNAVITTRAPIKGRLEFDFFGDWTNVSGKTDNSASRGVKVWATFKGETEPRVLEIGMHQVGSVRNSPMWVSDPRQQLAYLAVKRWSRLYCPDVILGVYTADEFEPAPEVNVTPQPSKTSSVRDKVAAKYAAKTAPVVDSTATAFDAQAALDAIHHATTLEELQAIAATLPKGLGEPEKTIIREAYADQKKALSQMAKAFMPAESVMAIMAEFAACGENDALNALWESRVLQHVADIDSVDYQTLETAFVAQMDAINQ